MGGLNLSRQRIAFKMNGNANRQCFGKNVVSEDTGSNPVPHLSPQRHTCLPFVLVRPLTHVLSVTQR